VVFGAGAGVGALAVFLGCMVAVLGRRSPPPAPPEDKDATHEPRP
jgi:hypothetical protein